jgi:uncharacterized protein (TIGR02996 family)
MGEEAGFLSAIRQTPADETARLVYADWLDEQGDPTHTAKAAFIRAELQLAQDDPTQLRELALPLCLDWLAIVSHPQIEACRFTPRDACPKAWPALTPTPNTRLRFCESCKKHVRYCDAVEPARDLVRRDHCVAISPAVAREPGDLYVLLPQDAGWISPVTILTSAVMAGRVREAARRSAGYRNAAFLRPTIAEEPPDDAVRPPPREPRRQNGRTRNRNIQRQDWEEE